MKAKFRSIKSIIYRISDLTPEKKALSVVGGFYLGIFPLTGVTAVLCQAAVFRFKLNVVLVHSINLALAPLQVLLMYPMMKLGRVLFFNDHRVIPEIKSWINGALSNTEMLFYVLQTLWAGMAIWSILVATTGYFFYRFVLKIISK